MAEIQDTSGAKPQLRRYQSKGVQIKDTPNRKGGGEVEGSTAKMYDSISGSLETVINVGNKMRRLALEEEKVKISAEMQGHYIDSTSALSNGMNKQSTEQLTGFEDLYGSGKLDGSYKGLKEYVVPNGYSKKAQEEMAPFIKLAEKKFQADAMKLHFGELIKRSDNQLSLLEAKSLSGLSIKLEEYESARGSTGTTTDKDGKKVKRMFAHATGQGIDNQKATEANNLLSNYHGVLAGKVERGLMSQSKMNIRIENYGQALGSVTFEHYRGLDEEKAFDLALKRGIVIDPDIDGIKPIIYNDPKLADYINQTRITERSELQTNKRNVYLQEQALLFKDKGAKAWIKENIAFDPDAIREGEPTAEVKWKAGKPGESRTGTVEQKVTRSKRKYTAKEQEARMDEMAGIIFKKEGKEGGFTSAAHVKSHYLGLMLKAKGQEKAYIGYKRTEDARRTKQYLETLKGAFANIQRNPNKLQRHTAISSAFTANPETGMWKVKDSYIQEMVDSGEVNELDARNFMALITPGIPVRNPGQGLDDDGLAKLQSAIGNYYHSKLFLKDEGTHNPNPLTQTEEYDLYLMEGNIKQENLIAEMVNNFEAIISFDEDNFKDKSSVTLVDQWKKLVKTQTSSTDAKRSRAMALIGDTYQAGVLTARVRALDTNPNGTFMKDLDIVFDPEVGITDDIKTRLNKKYKITGQNRSGLDGGVGPPPALEQQWIYIPENLALEWLSPFDITTPPSALKEDKNRNVKP